MYIKVNIDSNLARKLVIDQFPQWAELPVVAVARSGWDNRTFRLGDGFSIRLPSAESYVAQVPKEQEWLPYLGEQLSTQIPRVVAQGKPGCGYPWNWSVYQWIDAHDIEPGINVHEVELAKSVAQFLSELHTVDQLTGPPPGLHNYYRGGSLLEYDKDARKYLSLLADEICSATALCIWTRALETEWTASPVWVHGDLEASNILVSGGKLAAVIDFGSCAVGDPACDLVMAWTYFDNEAREVFQANLGIDRDTWDRGKAWALWKALFRMNESLEWRDDEFRSAKRIVECILALS